MRKLSKKAKRLIIDFSSAAADLTNKAIRPNFIQFGEARAALMDYIAELEGKIDQLTAHSDIERQDDKSSNDTQTQTIVYGKEDSEVQDV